jgi:hypothetical protein
MYVGYQHKVVPERSRQGRIVAGGVSTKRKAEIESISAFLFRAWWE